MLFPARWIRNEFKSGQRVSGPSVFPFDLFGVFYLICSADDNPIRLCKMLKSSKDQWLFGIIGFMCKSNVFF